MKYVDSGSGKIPFITLVAILSISLTVNLPGLAISPIMGKLDKVFGNVTQLEVQLLTVLPNLVTIPFILCAGKICTHKNQIFVLGAGLVIYALSGVLYFFADSMVMLIVLSCVLGVGCGLVIPLAASLISQNFVGKARTRQLGMKSGLSNFTVIFATLFVGWVAAYSWHLSFIVYLIPLIPLCLIPFMSDRFISKHRIVETETPEVVAESKIADPKVDKGRKAIKLLLGVMAIYFLATYGIEVVSYYLPFTMSSYHLDTGKVGVATAMFFAMATCAGFFLSKALKLLGRNTMPVAIAICIGGLLVTGLLHSYATYIVGVAAMGLGYGIIQPVIYDKTSYLAPDQTKSTAYFSYLLACNYIGISLVPFIIDGAGDLLHDSGRLDFSYVFNACILGVVLIVAIWKRKSFVFSVADTKSNPSAVDKM